MATTFEIKEGDNGQLDGKVGHAGVDPPLLGASSLVLYAREVVNLRLFRADDPAGLAPTNAIDGEAVDSFEDDGDFTWLPDAPAPTNTSKLRTRYAMYALATYAGNVEVRFPSRGYFDFVTGLNFES